MLQTQKLADTMVVRPSGMITLSNAHELQQDLNEIVNSGETNITIDLANVNMIDSKGLSVFVQCYKSLTAIGGTLTVVTDDEDLRGLFSVMHLDRHFAVRTTL